MTKEIIEQIFDELENKDISESNIESCVDEVVFDLQGMVVAEFKDSHHIRAKVYGKAISYLASEMGKRYISDPEDLLKKDFQDFKTSIAFVYTEDDDPFKPV